MTPGDERYERLEHRMLFLRARGLVSRDMEQATRQLWLLGRLIGKDVGKLDPQLVDRIHVELEQATLEQLRVEGLVDEWLESWEAESTRSSAQASGGAANPDSSGSRQARDVLGATRT